MKNLNSIILKLREKAYQLEDIGNTNERERGAGMIEVLNNIDEYFKNHLLIQWSEKDLAELCFKQYGENWKDFIIEDNFLKVLGYLAENYDPANGVNEFHVKLAISIFCNK